MQEMMHNFNRMSLQTGGNGVNPLVQAQMMNELKYRRLYEEERSRNENLERKMSSLIDRIERHTENNMKIKAKYSKEIEHLRYEVNMLQRENEDLRMNEQRGGEGLQREIEGLNSAKMDLESQLGMVQNELEMTKMRLEEEMQKKGGNPEKEMELEGQLQGMRTQMQRMEEELRVAKSIAEEERQKGGRERNELEVEKHKMELNIEHWKGQTEQMQREIHGLRDMLDYEKGAKMRLEDRVRDLESRSFGGWNNGGNNYGSSRGELEKPVENRREPPRNYPPMGNYSSRQNQNQNTYNQYQNKGGFSNPQQKKEDIVFGKPSFPGRRGMSPGMNNASPKNRSNSPFALHDNLNIYGNQNRDPPSNIRANMGTNNERSTYGRNQAPNQGGRMTNDFGSGIDRKSDSRWGSARPWENQPKQAEEESGALDSIASKRMAVRRGRGKKEKGRVNLKPSGRIIQVQGKLVKTTFNFHSRQFLQIRKLLSFS